MLAIHAFITNKLGLISQLYDLLHNISLIHNNYIWD